MIRHVSFRSNTIFFISKRSFFFDDSMSQNSSPNNGKSASPASGRSSVAGDQDERGSHGGIVVVKLDFGGMKFTTCASDTCSCLVM